MTGPASSSEAVDAAADLPPAGQAHGLPAVQRVLEVALCRVLAGGSRRVALMAPDLLDWPLSSPAVLAAWQHWGSQGGGRQLEVLALNWHGVERRHARLLAWRRHFDHLLRPRGLDPDEGLSSCPALLVSQEGLVLRVFEGEPPRVHWSHDARERQAAWEAFDAIAQRSGPAWPLSTLGL